MWSSPAAYRLTPEGSYLMTPTARLNAMRELAPFDRAAFPSQPEFRTIYTAASLLPYARYPKANYSLLKTYHKFDENAACEAFLARLRTPFFEEDLGLVTSRKFQYLLPANNTVYLVLDYEVDEDQMHRVLREAEKLDAFIGSKLPMNWVDSPFYEMRSSSPHRIIFDPDETLDGFHRFD